MFSRRTRRGGRSGDWTQISNATRQGYTGHEHLDNINIVHMNGRVFDPALGRFLSPDRVIRDVGASQSRSGYGYVEGRNLSWTDPSGWAAKQGMTLVLPILKNEPTPSVGQIMSSIREVAGDDPFLNWFANSMLALSPSGQVRNLAGQIRPQPSNGAAGGFSQNQGGGPSSDTNAVCDGCLPEVIVTASRGVGYESMSWSSRGVLYTTYVNEISGEHLYTMSDFICTQSTRGCNDAYADRVFEYVNANDIPLNGDNDLGPGVRNLLGFMPIYHSESIQNRTSKNITLENHPFNPGDVTHDVNFIGSDLYYDVVGSGFGPWPALNNSIGIALFGPVVETVVEQFDR